ncbi:P60-like protein, partial [Ramicandelaber brevisporus]
MSSVSAVPKQAIDSGSNNSSSSKPTRPAASQPSRKSKKSWRRNIDITDVEAGLDTLRKDEMMYGTHASEQPDEALFTVDTTGSEAIKTQLKSHKKKLKVEQILDERSKVRAVTSKVVPTDTKNKAADLVGVAKLLAKPQVSETRGSEKKEVSRIAKARGFEQSKKDKKAAKDRSRKIAAGFANKVASYDMWGSNNDDAPAGSDEKPPQPIYNASPAIVEVQKTAIKVGGNALLNGILESRKPKAVKIPETMQLSKHKKGINVPHVPIVHPGASYQPAEQDRQALVEMAAAVEMKRLAAETKDREIAHAIRSAKSSNIDDEVEDDSDDSDDSSNDDGDNVENDESSDDDDAEIEEEKMKTKTKTDRNRELRTRQHEANRRAKLEKAAMLKEAENAAEYKAAAEQTLALSEKRAEERQQAQESANAGVQTKIGGKRIADMPLDVQLSDEVASSLRTLKPEGNLFAERMVAMQQRGMMVPKAVAKKQRKNGYKEYEKQSYRFF